MSESTMDMERDNLGLSEPREGDDSYRARCLWLRNKYGCLRLSKIWKLYLRGFEGLFVAGGNPFWKFSRVFASTLFINYRHSHLLFGILLLSVLFTPRFTPLHLHPPSRSLLRIIGLRPCFISLIDLAILLSHRRIVIAIVYPRYFIYGSTILS
jgi:hypothetical protein